MDPASSKKKKKSNKVAMSEKQTDATQTPRALSVYFLCSAFLSFTEGDSEHYISRVRPCSSLFERHSTGEFFFSFFLSN